MHVTDTFVTLPRMMDTKTAGEMLAWKHQLYELHTYLVATRGSTLEPVIRGIIYSTGWEKEWNFIAAMEPFLLAYLLKKGDIDESDIEPTPHFNRYDEHKKYFIEYEMVDDRNDLGSFILRLGDFDVTGHFQDGRRIRVDFSELLNTSEGTVYP